MAAAEEEVDNYSSSAQLLRTNSGSFPAVKTRESQWKIERSNLLNICNLCVKNLIEFSLQLGRVLGDEHGPLQQFFIVMEQVLRHGLKVKRNILGQRKDYWGPVEALEVVLPEAKETSSSVRNLPGIKTNLGRGRAWMRLAMMQKRLDEYIRNLVERKDILSEWYEPWAVLMQDEGMVICGLLVGLNIIDCNICVKGEDLDSQAGAIDFSLYLKDGNYLDKPQVTEDKKSTDEDDSININTLLDQKAYLEEVNKNLQSNVFDIQNKMKSLEDSNFSLKKELVELQFSLEQTGNERDRLKSDQETVIQLNMRKLEQAQADISTERDTYQKSREGLNDMYLNMRKEFDLEVQKRKEVEKEVMLQKTMKLENDQAIKLLEKDINDKQDTLVSLRKQLEDVKKLNLDLSQKLKNCEGTNKQLMEKWVLMQEKTAKLISENRDLEESMKTAISEHAAIEETSQHLSQLLAESDSKRSAVETELKIEREWRISLQGNFEREAERCRNLENEMKSFDRLKQEHSELQQKHKDLQKLYAEQETAMVEMGSTLSNSQQKMEEMKEVTVAMKEMKWADDKAAVNCQLCSQAFSLSRRKHHCRSCGGIFCQQCSDNTMPLPSSAKPVRVCDGCYDVLLQRYQKS